MNHRALILGVCTLVLTGLAGHVDGQQNEPRMSTEAEPMQNDSMRTSRSWMDRTVVSLHGGFEHQFETDIDDGGDFSVTRGGVGITTRTSINEDVTLSFRFDYNLDAYDFSGTSSGLGVSDPWDEVHTVSLGAILSFDAGNEWTFFGGPLLQFSGESGADFSDAISGGGLFAATYRANERLTIGGGIGVVSQIEDSARLFPVFVINWQINDRLALRNTSASGAGTRGGLELVYDLEGGWEAAIGGAYQFKRFRLDDRSNASDEGVGEDSSIPIWGRLTYRVGENGRVTFYGGVAMNGELRLETNSGNGIADSDYDTAAVIGISGSIRF